MEEPGSNHPPQTQQGRTVGGLEKRCQGPTKGCTAHTCSSKWRTLSQTTSQAGDGGDSAVAGVTLTSTQIPFSTPLSRTGRVQVPGSGCGATVDDIRLGVQRTTSAKVLVRLASVSRPWPATRGL